MGECADNSVEIKASHNCPNNIIFNIAGCRVGRSEEERIHAENKHNIEKVCYNLHLFLAPFSDAERSKKHTPKGRITVNGCNNCICTLRAGTAVVAKPIKNICICGFEEANPSGKRNNPEILIFCYFAEGICKFDLNNMGFCLNNFFLSIGINNKYKKSADNADNGECNSVNLNICLVCAYNSGNKRNNNVVNGWTE